MLCFQANKLQLCSNNFVDFYFKIANYFKIRKFVRFVKKGELSLHMHAITKMDIDYNFFVIIIIISRIVTLNLLL